MGGQLFFSSGAAARQLGTSPDTIRRLVAAGSIPSESTPGGQVRIGSQVVEELRRTGLPSLPKPLPGDTQRSGANPRYGSAALLGAPSDEVVSAAEQVAITEARLRQRRLERELEETEDWFTERESAEAEREAEQIRQEQSRLAHDQAKQERDVWLQRWERFALRALPYDMEPQDEFDLSEAVRTRLAGLAPIPDQYVTRKLVDAEVDKIVQARKRWRDIEEILLECRDRTLPAQAITPFGLSEWQVKAVRAAGAVIGKLRGGAPLAEIRAAAKQAVAPVIQEFQALQAARADTQMRESITRWTSLPDALTDQGKELATQAIAEAIGKHPQGTPRGKLEQARDAALVPFRAAVAQAQAEARKQAEAARKLSEAEFRVGLRMAHVFEYLDRLKDEVEFDGFSDRWATGEKLKKTIQPILVQELLRKPDLTDTQIHKRIEKLVDEHLDSVLAA